ncbi:MAG: hypothetical protein EOP39_19485 [Rubrivivax sp.]|nr:MAG: hypothetical protein EOP39_19485 [Rubrivivax sp.]
MAPARRRGRCARAWRPHGRPSAGWGIPARPSVRAPPSQGRPRPGPRPVAGRVPARRVVAQAARRSPRAARWTSW